MEMNLMEIRKKEIEALEKALGPVGMVRFLHQFDPGAGDYTKERSQWLEKHDIDSIAKEIKERKTS